jgi:predicted transcriptional regulator
MAKTVTVRLDDRVYELIRKAADGERRSISNYLEYAALRYLTDELTVSDSEMELILADEARVASLRQGLADAEAGRYRVAE